MGLEKVREDGVYLRLGLEAFPGQGEVLRLPLGERHFEFFLLGPWVVLGWCCVG